MTGPPATPAGQILTRFGALSHCLAAAVRHALDNAVTYTALTPMNAVHLRMTLIAEILDSELSPEPPSHRWYEFMVECFGQNSVGLRNSTARPSDSGSNATALVHIDFAESYVTNETEDRVIHDLFVAAGVFLVAESTVMDEQIEQWNIAGRDGFISEELCSIAGRAGVVGFDLLEHAEAGTWRDLLSAITREPDAAIKNAGQTHVPSAPATTLPRANRSWVGGSSDTENPDYVVLIVDTVEASHRQALTERALCELRETVNNYGESSPKDSVVVVSTADGRQATSLPLTSQRLNKSPEEDSSNERPIEYALNQVAELVEVMSQPADGVSTIAASITRPLVEQRDLIAGIYSAARTYHPILLIILSSEYSSVSPIDLRNKPDPGSNPRELVETLRNQSLLPDLRGVSVVFLWSAPSRETHLGPYLLTVCTAAGALSCEFHVSSPKRGSASVPPAGGQFRDKNASAASPGTPEPIFGSAKIGPRKLPVRAGHVRLCDEGPVGAPGDDEGSDQPADLPERVVSVVAPPPAGGRLSYIFANIHRTRGALILVASTSVIVVVGIPAVHIMTDIIPFLLVGVLLIVLLCVGVLIGSSLHTGSIDRRYRRVAQLAGKLTERKTVMDGRGCPRCDPWH